MSKATKVLNKVTTRSPAPRTSKYTLENQRLNILMLACVATLSACGGGSGSTAINPLDPLAPPNDMELSTARSLYATDPESGSDDNGDSDGDGGVTGGAGDGAPIKKAVVTLVDKNGKQVSGLTDINGQYLLKFKAAAFTAPLVVRVIDAGGNVLSSVTDEVPATGKAILANINPLTDKITSDTLSSTVPGTDKAFDGSKIDLAKLPKAKADLVASVKDALGATGITDTSKFDPIKSVYAYDGKGVDAVIESISHTREAVTGATQLRAKLAGVTYNADGTVVPTLISASTPLTTAQVALPGSSGLTYDKLNAWITEINRCLALPNSDVDCDNSGVDSSTTEPRLISPSFTHNSMDFKEAHRTLFSNPGTSNAVKNSTFRNPVLLFTTKSSGNTSTTDNLAVVEVTIRQPSVGSLADASTTPVEYTKTIVFRRDDTLTKAKAGNWIAYGNHRTFDAGVRTRYSKSQQMNSALAANTSGGQPGTIESRINFNFNLNKYNKTTQAWESANVRAVRVTGPGLPSAGIVMLPSTVNGRDSLAIGNKTGTIPTTTQTTTNSGNSFALAVAAADGAPVYSGFYNPNGVDRSNPMLADADFSKLQTYARYTYEVFLNSNTSGTADVVEQTVNLAPVYAPSAILAMQFNDLTTSTAALSAPLVTAPAAAASAITVQWANNPNASLVTAASVYAEERSPKGATTGFTTVKWDVYKNVTGAYRLANRPTSQTVTAPASSPTFPSLATATPGDYRHVVVWANQGRALMENRLKWNN